MIPTPKKVAEAIRRMLFRTTEERRQEKEMNRDVQVRMGKARLRRYITHQKKIHARLKALAKRALSLNDDPRFRQVGRQMLWTEADIRRWEQYELTLDILAARREQANASLEVLNAVKAMSESLAELSSPRQAAELQQQLEEGLVRASSLEERMALMMELMDDTLSAGMPTEESELSSLETDLVSEIMQEERAAFDPEIEAGLQKIKAELEGDKK